MDISTLPQLVEIVMKGGVVAVLLIVIFVLGGDYVRLRRQNVSTFKERDAYRLRYVLYKAECDRNNLKVDTSALDPIPGLES